MAGFVNNVKTHANDGRKVNMKTKYFKVYMSIGYTGKLKRYIFDMENFELFSCFDRLYQK